MSSDIDGEKATTSGSDEGAQSKADDETTSQNAAKEPKEADKKEEPKKTDEMTLKPRAAKDASKKKSEKAVAVKGSSKPKGKKARRRAGLPTFGWIAIALACLGVGIIVGHFVLPVSFGSSLASQTTVTEDHLSDVLGTYTYDGKTHNVTVQDVIEQSSTLDSAKNDDDSYTIPAVDGVLSAARNQIVLDEAEKRGDTASDDEAASFAEEQLGTSDYSTIASNYSIDEDTAETMIKNAATMSKLRDEVVTTEVPDAPTAPTAPSDGNTDTASQDYATYIINLAGDEWDSANNTWADSSSDYATALADYTVTNDSATYGAAQAAYYVAYQKYSEVSSSASSEWYSFCNSLFDNATVTINSLVTSAS